MLAGKKMPAINYIIDEKTVSKLTKNKAWLETYIPEAVKRLEAQGFSVVFDKDQDFDLMHIHMPLRLAKKILGKCRGSRGFPVIYHGHATEDSFTVGSGIKKLARKWLKSVAVKSDLIICPSASAKEYYEALLPGHATMQLNYGINLGSYKYSKYSRIKFRKQHGIREDETVVCCVAGVSIRKGVDDFIEASKRHPGLRFMWVGGDYTQHPLISLFYKMLAREGDVCIKDLPPAILAPGYMHNVADALSASDIFFFPSRHETQGLALVEAAANGRPIVARCLPVFREWLKDGRDCLMGKNADDFTAHIKTLSENPPLAARLGRNALEAAKKHHDIDITTKKLAGIYAMQIRNFGKRKKHI